MEPLTERQQIVLHCVVGAHIESAQPVASRHLTEHCGIHYSPATVRHEMGFLEELGYLTHPHTSSGRVPTDSGYRYYVDYCLDEAEVPEHTVHQLADELWGVRVEEGDDACAEGATRILALLSKETSLVVVWDSANEVTGPSRRGQLFVQGSTYILEKPEFRDVQKVRTLFDAFEEKRALINWLSRLSVRKGVSVGIGRENEPEALWDCSIVGAHYVLRGRQGSIAVLGPRRMRYARAVPLVEKTAELIEQILS